MNFDDSPADSAFRAEVRAWLAANAPEFELQGHVSKATEATISRAWQARKAAAGYAAFGWPKELGGRGGEAYQQLIFVDEEARFRLPWDFSHSGIDLVLQTLINVAQPPQYAALTEPTRTGQITWSMLFSEPSAGSDVSAVRLKAVRDGDDWVLNGQKTWTSWTDFSDWAVTIARTDPTVPKHRGLSCFIHDVRTAGVQVRPIKFFEGDAHGFDDVFYTDARIPHAQLIGREGDGWKIFLAMLALDRFTSSSHREIAGTNFWPILALAREAEGEAGRRIDERDVRHRLADYFVDIEGVNNLRARHLTSISRGADVGPETAIGKLVLANRLQEMAAFAMDMLGPVGGIVGSWRERESATIREAYFNSAGYRIGAGTDEIIRNSIGERILGLPGDVRTDKDVPFNQLGNLAVRR